MKIPMLKHLLIKPLVLEPLWTSQILIQMIDMSDLGETLMNLSLDAKMISLRMWFFLMIFLTTLEEMRVLVSSKKKGILMILRYDLD